MHNRPDWANFLSKQKAALEMKKIELDDFSKESKTISFLRSNKWNYTLLNERQRKSYLKNAPEDIQLIYRLAKDMWETLEESKALFTDTPLKKNHELLCLFAKNQYAFMFHLTSYLNETDWKKVANLSRRLIAGCIDFLANEIFAYKDTYPGLVQFAKELQTTASLFLLDENEKQLKHKQISAVIDMMLEDEQAPLLEKEISEICQNTLALKQTLFDVGQALKTIDLSDSKNSSDQQQLHQLKLVATALLDFAESDPAINQPRRNEEERRDQAKIDRIVAANCLSCFVDEMKRIATSPLLFKKQGLAWSFRLIL